MGKYLPKKTSPFLKKILSFGNFSVCRVIGCCYGYCNQFCDWSVQLSGLHIIGCLTVLIQDIGLQPVVRLQLHRIIILQNQKNKAGTEPITVEEFVIVMIIIVVVETIVIMTIAIIAMTKMT